MQAITVHCAWTTDSFPAGTSKWKSWIKIVLDVDQSIEVHRRNGFEVDVVAHIFRLVRGIFRIVLVNEKSLHFGFLLFCEWWVMLLDVVRVHVALHSWCDTFKEDSGFWFIWGEESPQWSTQQHQNNNDSQGIILYSLIDWITQISNSFKLSNHQSQRSISQGNSWYRTDERVRLRVINSDL